MISRLIILILALVSGACEKHQQADNNPEGTFSKLAQDELIILDYSILGDFGDHYEGRLVFSREEMCLYEPEESGVDGQRRDWVFKSKFPLSTKELQDLDESIAFYRNPDSFYEHSDPPFSGYSFSFRRNGVDIWAEGFGGRLNYRRAEEEKITTFGSIFGRFDEEGISE